MTQHRKWQKYNGHKKNAGAGKRTERGGVTARQRQNVERELQEMRERSSEEEEEGKTKKERV